LAWLLLLSHQVKLTSKWIMTRIFSTVSQSLEKYTDLTTEQYALLSSRLSVAMLPEQLAAYERAKAHPIVNFYSAERLYVNVNEHLQVLPGGLDALGIAEFITAFCASLPCGASVPALSSKLDRQNEYLEKDVFVLSYTVHTPVTEDEAMTLAIGDIKSTVNNFIWRLKHQAGSKTKDLTTYFVLRFPECFAGL
jgi:hypothetical protein